MKSKKWITAVAILAVLVIAFVWMKGTSQITEGESSIRYAGSSVPAPGPGEKKVALKNLGMT